MYSIDDYDFNVFDQSKKYHLHIDADNLVMACAVVIRSTLFDCFAFLFLNPISFDYPKDFAPYL